MDIRSVVFAQYFVPLQLVLVLTVGTYCEQVPPLTCSDTASRDLADISSRYHCTPPEHGLVECKRTIMVGEWHRYAIEARFIVLDEVPETDVFTTCVGLEKYTTNFEAETTLWTHIAEFNSSMAVGILTADQHTILETNRICNISILKDILQLLMFDQKGSSNFSSPFYGMKLKWFLRYTIGLHTFYIVEDMLQILQNTSLQLLNVTGRMRSGHGVGLLINNMPSLKKLILRSDIRLFHEESFIGMPQMESLIIDGSNLEEIPQTLKRIPQLRTLHILNNNGRLYDPFRTLLNLNHLEDIEINKQDLTNTMYYIPPLTTLKRLSLCECKNVEYELKDYYLPQLKELYLSGNKIQILEENSITNFKNMELLDLSVNSLKNLHQINFTHLQKLEFLNLSSNSLRHLEENTFYHLNNLTVLDLSNNNLNNWPIAFDCSLRLLDLSHNSLTYIHNLGGTQTTVEYLNISSNKINNWKDINIFSVKKSAKCPNNMWVKNVNLSNNAIVYFSELMCKSTTGLQLLDLGDNQFDCEDCRMIPLQKFLSESSVLVMNLGTSDPLLCSSPYHYRAHAISEVQFDEKPCLKIQEGPWLSVGIHLGILVFAACVVGAVVIKYRGQITYMLHLYNIKRRAQDYSQTNFNTYAFDAFICYSSHDRRFVLTRLAPLLEKGEERYKLCLHERDFPLGSRIVDNIVGTIQHSRKTIIVLSEHFVKSKWCNWELGMAHDKMFNEDDHFLILIQLGELDRSKLPLHLKVLMSTRTYLDWPAEDHKNDEQICKRLKRALGPSIIDTTHEPPISLSDIIYSDCN